MPDPNEDFQEFCDVLRSYCKGEREAAKGRPFDQVAATQLIGVFKRILPTLTAEVSDAPEVVSARYVVEYAVETLNDEVMTVIWHEYFTSGISVDKIAYNKLVYSTDSIRNFIADFPKKTARHLWIIELELSSPLPITPGIWHRRARKILEDEFDLSRAQANTLLALCYGRKFNLSRNEISKYVVRRSKNTVKAHLGRIYPRMKVNGMREAGDKALAVLGKYLGADWDRFIRDLTMDELVRLYSEHLF